MVYVIFTLIRSMSLIEWFVGWWERLFNPRPPLQYVDPQFSSDEDESEIQESTFDGSFYVVHASTPIKLGRR